MGRGGGRVVVNMVRYPLPHIPRRGGYWGRELLIKSSTTPLRVEWEITWLRRDEDISVLQNQPQGKLDKK